jgi:hypothetical protein
VDSQQLQLILGRDYAPVHEQPCNLITEEGPGQIYAEHLKQGGGSPTYLYAHPVQYRPKHGSLSRLDQVNHSFIQHYYLQLPQVARRLLKIYSVTGRSQYAHFNPRFFKNSFIISFEGGTS